MTSAGVTRDAAGTPAMAPAASRERGWLYPFSSAKDAWKINCLDTDCPILINLDNQNL